MGHFWVQIPGSSGSLLDANQHSSGLERIRTALAAMRTQARESNPLAAALHSRRLVSQRSLVVMFTDAARRTVIGL